MSHRHNFVTISGRKFTENAEKPGRRAPERVPLPGFLSIKWHVVFKMKAHRRPVSGCGSQRMLHALERRSHPADHGPSFASLFPPLAAVSSAAIPVRVKLKTPLRIAAAATTLDIPTGWDPNTKKEPTGLFFAACGRPCSFDSSYGLHEKIPDPKIRDFIHDPYGNRTHVTAVKGPCLNRLTNGPYKYRASLKPPTFIVHYCGRPSPLS